MLLFRSEEHVRRWQQATGITGGESFPVEQCWRLAQRWHSDRLSPAWRRRTPAESEAIFREVGLGSDFWTLT